MEEERSSESADRDCGEFVFRNNSGCEICRYDLNSDISVRRAVTGTLFHANRRGELKWEKYQEYFDLIWRDTLYGKEGSILAIFNRKDKVSVNRVYGNTYGCWKNRKIPATLFIVHVRTLQGFGLELNDNDRKTIREAESLMVEGAIDNLVKREKGLVDILRLE